MHTISVSWQNWRHRQSLVADGRVKQQQQNNAFCNVFFVFLNYV